jgi:hypothetical protein
MIINTFHQKYSLHYTSNQFTSLHFPFSTSLHFWTFRHRPSKTLHFKKKKKICDLEGKVPSPLQAVGSTVWFSYLQTNIYRYLFFVSWPNFTIVIIPAQVAWSLLPVHCSLPCRNIFSHYFVVLASENISLCEWV